MTELWHVFILGGLIGSAQGGIQALSRSYYAKIIPKDKAQEMEKQLPEVPTSPSNHFKNFLLGCKGQEKCRSSFDISGPLSQVFTLGVMAQRMSTRIIFDRKTKQVTNNKFANQMLVGQPPRKGWEEYYKL
jgi:hypothetical protein